MVKKSHDKSHDKPPVEEAPEDIFKESEESKTVHIEAASDPVDWTDDEDAGLSMPVMPAVGDIVIFHKSVDAPPAAAIVIQSHEGSIDLHVFPPGDIYTPTYKVMGVTGNKSSGSWFKVK